ncbi:hypothetical protein C3L33_16005, partial [Rhododendron williamsianum]
MVSNSEFALWNLVDSQLLSCLLASLSQNILPYVLGLDHAYQVWQSLSSRYNSLSRAHVHDVRDRLYNVTKTSTMEAYIDTIKGYAQRLAAAGCPMEDDDLVFHTLRGLKSKAFDGFKTAVRLRGDDITFDELITRLNGEDMQMIKDDEVVTTSVLVATHGNSSVPNSIPQGQLGSVQSVQQLHSSSTSIPMLPVIPQVGGANHNPNHFLPSYSSQQYMPQPQFYPSSSRNFYRGRGGRGPRFPRDPCEICGKSNHITSFCYYRPQFQAQFPQFPAYEQFSSGHWRGSQGSPWMNSSHIQYNFPMMPSQASFSGPRTSVRGPVNSSFPHSNFTGGFLPQMSQMAPASVSAQAHFAGSAGPSGIASPGPRHDQRCMDLSAFLLVLFLSSLFVCYNGVEGSIELSAREDLELENELKLLHKPAVKTIQTEYGDIYDCVDFYNQPAFDHPLLKNHSFYFEYAAVRTKAGAGNYNGAGAGLTLHRPRVNRGQHSAARVKIQNSVEAIEVGWRVDPDLYGGDTRTRSFIRVDDLANGNWWLLIREDFTPVGFWPKRIFRDLANPANYVEWGGKVYTPPGTGPTPEMGSGRFLRIDRRYDAYFRNIQVINGFGQNVDEFNTEIFRDSEKYEVVDLKNSEKFGHVVIYGGPPQ